MGMSCVSLELPDDALMSDQFSTIEGRAAMVCRYGNGKRD
jgi:hypothetical protein